MKCEMTPEAKLGSHPTPRSTAGPKEAERKGAGDLAALQAVLCKGTWWLSWGAGKQGQYQDTCPGGHQHVTMGVPTMHS